MSEQLDRTPGALDLPSGKSWLQVQTERRKQDLRNVMRQARILSLALRHPRVPWYAKLVAGSALGYLVSPIQLIPTFIPVVGQLDDILVLFAGMKLLRKLTPEDVLAECEAQAGSPIFLQPKGIACETGPPVEEQSSIPAA
jgi:uncharacterized membrane protein YkvA (DUF1232 family)